MIVQNVLMGMEIYKTIDRLMENVVVNTSASKEHVGKIERAICTVKDRTRCIFTTMNFQ